METMELENTVTKVKTHWMRPIGQWRKQDKIHKFEVRLIKFTQYKQQRTQTEKEHLEQVS